jgi:hypothetical protein
LTATAPLAEKIIMLVFDGPVKVKQNTFTGPEHQEESVL